METASATVFVGLSGGVDSSVAAWRLKREGYSVVGVFIKVWQPDFLNCNWEQERLDAMRVAAKLEIPFLTCDAEAAYKQGVADYFISEYQAGRTPNPDVMCNKHVKFGTFLDFAKAHGADFIATGHYARVERHDGLHSLWRGQDTNKDQSYFLWTLTQEQLSRTLLPVGNSEKATIRAEAKAAGLMTAQKKDSQGICFLGQVDIPEFLSHYVELVPGDVIDETGAVIGAHQGALVYTTGQRHGFSVHKKDTARQPHYVISRDLAHNTITVSPVQPQLTSGRSLHLSSGNWIGFLPEPGEVVMIQTRYRQQPTKGTIKHVSNDELWLELNEGTPSVSVGQSCVLYREDQCLGGGIIAG